MLPVPVVLNLDPDLFIVACGDGFSYVGKSLDQFGLCQLEEFGEQNPMPLPPIEDLLLEFHHGVMVLLRDTVDEYLRIIARLYILTQQFFTSYQSLGTGS